MFRPEARSSTFLTGPFAITQSGKGLRGVAARRLATVCG
jgi:hypothetical protein